MGRGRGGYEEKENGMGAESRAEGKKGITLLGFVSSPLLPLLPPFHLPCRTSLPSPSPPPPLPLPSPAPERHLKRQWRCGGGTGERSRPLEECACGKHRRVGRGAWGYLRVVVGECACVLGCLCQCVNACLCVGVGVLPFPFVLLSVRSRFAKVGFS